MRRFLSMVFAGSLVPAVSFAAGLSVIGTVAPGPSLHFPTGSVLLPRGNKLFGVFANTGPHDCGAVIRFAPPATPGSPWTKTVLYEFSGVDACPDPSSSGAGLVADASGNLFGANRNEIYKLSPPPGGGLPWRKTSLFMGGDSSIVTPLTFVPGSTTALVYATNGPFSNGDVRMLSNLDSTPTSTVMYAFKSGTDGRIPGGPLLAATINGVAGYYGVTYAGGTANRGTIYRIVPGATPGSFTEKVLYSFTGGADGRTPVGNLLVNSLNNRIFGVTAEGGNVSLCSNGCGTAFRLTPGAGDSWTAATIWTFNAGAPNTDGAIPAGGIAWDGADLVGVTKNWGTAPNAQGIAYRLVRVGNVWNETIIANFGLAQAAINPLQTPAVIKHRLYGTATWNDFRSAAVWEIK